LDVRKQEQALADIASGEAQYAAARKEALEEKKLASREEIERQRAESAERRQESRNEALARGLSGGRQTDRAGFVEDYVAGKREEGDKRPEAVLRLEGQQAFNNQQARFGLQEKQLQAQIIGQVDQEILARRTNPSTQERRAIRAWLEANKQNTEDSYWNAQRESRLTSKFAELAERSGSAPRAGASSAPTRLRYNPETGSLE
jgi:hypothetical protein